MMPGGSRTGAGFLGVGLLLLELAGCGSGVGLHGWIEALPSVRSFPLRSARILSAHPPYRVRWQIELKGRRYRGTTPLRLIESRLVSRGRYQNWRWRVEAPPAVARSWLLWHRDASGLGYVTRGDGGRRAYGWQEGFRRLYALVGRLEGETPKPAHITLLLVPWQQSVELHFDVRGRTAIPVVTAAWYPTTLRQSRLFQKVRFHALRAALADVGADLEIMDESAREQPGIKEHQRALDRRLENADCWQTAIRTALAAGTPGRFATTGIELAQTLDRPSVRSFLGELAEVERRNPSDRHVAALRADLEVLHRVSVFLVREHLHWPVHGRDRPAMQSLIQYCAGWTQGAGAGSGSAQVRLK